MTNYEIFSDCFPQLALTEEQFKRLTDYDSSTILTVEGGFALVKENRITLEAVHHKYRGNGIGTALASICEQEIINKGYDKVILGGRLFCGSLEESYAFWAMRGYSLGNEYCEMSIDLSDYNDPLPEVNAKFGFYSGMDSIRSAVGEVDEEWVQYFDGGQEYFCGFAGHDNRLVSFCIVGYDEECMISDGISEIGSVGCVGTIPAARGHGIGLKMVSLALEELKRRGCNKCFIHWTHLDRWYARLGAETVIRFRCGSKKL